MTRCPFLANLRRTRSNPALVYGLGAVPLGTAGSTRYERREEEQLELHALRILAFLSTDIFVGARCRHW